MTRLDQILVSVFERLHDHDRRLAASNLRGKVTHVDAEKGLARFEMGKDEDGNPVLSPWLPQAQHAGGLKGHFPLTVGQTVSMSAAAGDVEQGALSPFHWSDANPSPSSSGAENVVTFGNVTLTLAEGSLVASCGGVSVTISASGLHVTGGDVKHDGKSIGKSHAHTGVAPGGGLSGPPV